MTDPKQPHEPEVLDAEIVPTPGAVPPVEAPAPDYDEHGVPSFDYVRDRIEGRAATVAGWSELTGEEQRNRELDDQLAARDEAGRKKLEEMRKSLGL